MLGFSLGGRVALGMAFRHPDRIRGLIVGGMHARATRLTRDSMIKRTTTLRRGSVRALRRALRLNAGDSRDMPDPDPEALALSDEGLLNWPGVAEELPSLGVPTLVFAGEHDRRSSVRLSDITILCREWTQTEHHTSECKSEQEAEQDAPEVEGRRVHEWSSLGSIERAA